MWGEPEVDRAHPHAQGWGLSLALAQREGQLCPFCVFIAHNSTPAAPTPQSWAKGSSAPLQVILGTAVPWCVPSFVPVTSPPHGDTAGPTRGFQAPSWALSCSVPFWWHSEGGHSLHTHPALLQTEIKLFKPRFSSPT